ncbi:unnamed protein product, partial [Timema podura]|nr:unnamed protein product [Timema podura]
MANVSERYEYNSAEYTVRASTKRDSAVPPVHPLTSADKGEYRFPDLTFKIAIETAKAAEVAIKYVEDVRDEATTHGAVYGIGNQPQYKSTFQRTSQQDTNLSLQPQVGNPSSSREGSGEENRGRIARHFFPGQCLRYAGQHQTRHCMVNQNKLYCTSCDRREHVEVLCLSETRQGHIRKTSDPNPGRIHRPWTQSTWKSKGLTVHGLNVVGNTLANTEQNPTSINSQEELPVNGYRTNNNVTVKNALLTLSEVKDLSTLVQGYPAVADPTFGEFNGPMVRLELDPSISPKYCKASQVLFAKQNYVTPDMETRRQQQAAAAEKRLQEQDSRGIKNVDKVRRQQQRKEEMERREEEAAKQGGQGGLKVTLVVIL